MRIRGWVYVMTNKSMPGLVKIGASTKDPTERARELRGTNNPHDFVVEYDLLTFEPFAVEKSVHEHLIQTRILGSGQGREFFRCSVDEAVLAIRSITKEIPLPEFFHKADRERIERMEQEKLNIAAAERVKAEALHQEQLNKAKEAKLLAEAQTANQAQLRLAEEAELHANAARQVWMEDQTRRITSTYKDKTRENSLRLLHEGRLVICNCGRPLLANYEIVEKFICAGCKSTFSVPPRR